MCHRRPAASARHGARASEERSLTEEPRFIGSFPRADVSLTPALPEVALVGRSNVGKSSLLNALAGRKIGKVSGTPGKTRMLNVYLLGAGSRERYPPMQREEPLPALRSLYVLDLPGYGYSRASHTDRRAFRLLIEHTLNRARLAGVVWLLDLRREPSTEDHAMQERFAERDTRVLAALTKSDKLSRTERERRERELREVLGLDEDQVIATSAREGEGIGELREAIMELARGSS
ncbi:MAG TPA: ribosome biogenesis GTP-binding protein YihA/YsxC [Gemmatimonadales bacterium]|nr:ribosome biogenesis GTP-binding protein YihA/YsxC [Gemmatimonadales bacterium]